MHIHPYNFTHSVDTPLKPNILTFPLIHSSFFYQHCKIIWMNVHYFPNVPRITGNLRFVDFLSLKYGSYAMDRQTDVFVDSNYTHCRSVLATNAD